MREWKWSAMRNETKQQAVLGSIVVSILACHARDPGSIPGRGAFLFFLLYLFQRFSAFFTQRGDVFYVFLLLFLFVFGRIYNTQYKQQKKTKTMTLWPSG